MAYANGQQDAIWEQVRERRQEARNVKANVGRGASKARRVVVTRKAVAAFEAHCAALAAKNAALAALRLAAK